MWKTTICLILMIQNVIHITCTSVHNNTFIDWSLITDSTIHKLYAFPLHFIACLLTFASPHTRELQNKVTWGLRQNKQSTKRREFSASKMTIHCIRTAILWTTIYKINIRYGGGGRGSILNVLTVCWDTAYSRPALVRFCSSISPDDATSASLKDIAQCKFLSYNARK